MIESLFVDGIVPLEEGVLAGVYDAAILSGKNATAQQLVELLEHDIDATAFSDIVGGFAKYSSEKPVVRVSPDHADIMKQEVA